MSTENAAPRAPRSYDVEFSGRATVTVTDDRVILRVTENRDDQDRPEGHPEWDAEHAYRNTLYRIDSVNDVLSMLVWNAASNHVDHANRLDGWADLSDDAAVTVIDDIDVLHVIEPGVTS
jgi:hypothetical protein